MNETELINHILDGDKNAYRQIIEKYQHMVFRVCMGFIHEKEQANDLTQEIFLNAFIKLESFRGKSAFSTWLYRIAVNTNLNYLRKVGNRYIFQGRDIPIGEDKYAGTTLWKEEVPAPDRKIIDEQTAKEVNNAIDGLPERQRITFVLSNYDDLSQKEIAGIMGITEGAVEQLLQRAKVNLQKKLLDFYIKNYQ